MECSGNLAERLKLTDATIIESSPNEVHIYTENFHNLKQYLLGNEEKAEKWVMFDNIPEPIVKGIVDIINENRKLKKDLMIAEAALGRMIQSKEILGD